MKTAKYFIYIVIGAVICFALLAGAIAIKNTGGSSVSGETVTVEGESFKVTFNLENAVGDSSNGTTAPVADKYQYYYISARDGYTLPSAITVTGAEYTWDSSTGKLGLKNATETVVVKIAAVEMLDETDEVYNITYSLSNISTNSALQPYITVGSTGVTLTFVANPGYTLPSSITVTNCDFSWNPTTGKLLIYNPTGDVKVTVLADEVTYTLKGKWSCYNIESAPSIGQIYQNVSFTCYGGTYNRVEIYDNEDGSYIIKWRNTDGELVTVCDSTDYISPGFYEMDFGTEPVTVSAEFYVWFVANYAQNG